jgi:ribosomal protein S18 acetylase RimI-like enzyme
VAADAGLAQPARGLSAGNTRRAAAGAMGTHRDGAFAIRLARQSDIDAVIALDECITGLAKGPHWQELFDRGSKLRQAGQFFLVATATAGSPFLAGFIVGEVRAWEFGSAPCGWVYALGVDSAARQHGVGEGLLEAIAGEFIRAGVTKMRTMVAKESTLPMKFFRAEGMMAGPYIQLEKDLE